MKEPELTVTSHDTGFERPKQVSDLTSDERRVLLEELINSADVKELQFIDDQVDDRLDFLSEEDEGEPEDNREVVTTSCTRNGCDSSSAYKIGSHRTRGSLGGPMNMLQFICVKCGHSWNLGY